MIDELLLKSYWIGVAYANRHCGNYDYSKDVVQDVFCGFLYNERVRNIKFENEKAAKAFLFQAIRYKLMHYNVSNHSKISRMSVSIGPASSSDGVDVDVPDEYIDIDMDDETLVKHERLKSGLEKIPKRTKYIFHQIYVEERSMESVANELGISKGRLGSLIFNNKKILIKHINNIQRKITKAKPNGFRYINYMKGDKYKKRWRVKIFRKYLGIFETEEIAKKVVMDYFKNIKNG